MANTAVSTVDTSLIRTGTHIIESVRMNVVLPEIVTTLTVTAVPASVPYATLTVSGSLSGVTAGQQIKIYRGNTLKAWSVVRKAPSGSSLFVAPLSLGDPGVPAFIENAIEAGDTVIVYSARPMWGMYSSIQQRTFYKMWDEPYTDQNGTPPPKANAGVWQEESLTRGTALFTLPKGGINTSFGIGASLTGYLWSLPTGVTLRSGYSLTDQVIKVEADAGQHLVSLTVTDANGKSHTAYTWLFVENDTYASFGNRYVWEITADSNHTAEGREVSFRVVGDNLRDVLLPGAGVLFTEHSTFAGDTLAAGVLLDTFIGYISGDIEYSHNGDYGEAAFTVKSPYLVAGELPIPPQLLTEETSPNNWSECGSALSNPRGAIYYVAKWHCPALVDMHDWNTPHTTPRKKSVEFNTSSVSEALKIGAGILPGGNIGSASDGTLVLRQNPMLEDNSYRNAMPTVWTWTADDIKPDFKTTRSTRMATGEMRGGAFSYDGTTIRAYAVVKRWYQGTGKDTMPNFAVTSSDGLEKCKRVIGHYMAMQNAKTKSISVDVMGNIDIADPVYMDAWHILNISSEFDPDGEGWTNRRVLPVRIERNWSKDEAGIVKRMSVTFQPETYGQPGEEDPIGSAQSQFDGGGSGWSSAEPIPYEMEQESIPSLLLVGNSAGKIGITYNFTESDPDYRDLSSYFEFAWDACLDFNSAYFTGGYDLTQPIGVYVVGTSGSTISVYRIEDLINPGTDITLLKEWTMADTFSPHTGRVVCSEGTPTLVAVSWKDRRGTRVARSTDGGTTWAEDASPDAVISDIEANDSVYAALAVDGTNVLVTAPNSSAQYGIYKATSGGAFTALGSTPRVDTPQPTIYPDGDGRLYVSAPATSINTYTVTFDAGGSAYSTGSVTGLTAAPGTRTEAGSGHPGFGQQWTLASGTTTDGTVYLGINFDSTSGTTVTQIEFDVFGNWSTFTGMLFAGALSIGWVDGTGVFSNAFCDCNYDTSGNATSISVTSGTGGMTGDWRNAWRAISTTHNLPHTFSSDLQLRVRLTRGGSMTNADFRIDNIRITFSPAIGGTPHLYRVDTYAGTPSWVNITPVGNYIPAHPYALTTNQADAQNFHTIGASSGVYYWHESANRGTSYASNTVTDYRFLKKAGDVVIAGGNELIQLSLDGGTTIQEKNGNLSSVWGSIGQLLWAVVVL